VEQQWWRWRFYRRRKKKSKSLSDSFFWSMAAQFWENSSLFRTCGLTQNERRRPQKKVFSSYTAQLAIFALHFDALCLVCVCTHHRSRPIKEAPRIEEENKKGTSSPNTFPTTHACKHVRTHSRQGEIFKGTTSAPLWYYLIRHATQIYI